MKKILVLFVLLMLFVGVNSAQTKSEFCNDFEVSLNEGTVYKSTVSYSEDVMIVTIPIQKLAKVGGVTIDMFRRGMQGKGYKENMGKALADTFAPYKSQFNSVGFYYLIYRIIDIDGTITSSKKLLIQHYNTPY